jgi:uncharacterized membrane protein YsdA (DUF1294 family)
MRHLIMPDQSLICTTCGQRFTWSTGEQQFYRERGLQAPRRCPDCRAAKRQQPATPAARTRAPSQQAARPIVSRRTPRRTFGLATLAAAGALSVALFMLVPSGPLLAWLLAINLIAVLTYGYDKAIAGGTRMRVPEAVLLGLALIGGSPGAFVGMLLFRHKTSKPAFLVPFSLIVALQVGLIIAWLVLGQGQ